MKLLIWCMLSIVILALSACDDGKKTGDNMARDITGANLIDQGKLMQDKVRDLGQQQKERYENME